MQLELLHVRMSLFLLGQLPALAPAALALPERKQRLQEVYVQVHFMHTALHSSCSVRPNLPASAGAYVAVETRSAHSRREERLAKQDAKRQKLRQDLERKEKQGAAAKSEEEQARARLKVWGG